VPAVGSRSPAMTLNSVVLPAPLGPRMTSRSPWPTSRSMPSRASRPPNRTRSPLTCTMGSRGAAARVGSVVMTAGAPVSLLVLRDAVHHRDEVARPRQVALLARREVARRRRRLGAEGATKGLVDLGDHRHGLLDDLAALLVHGELRQVHVDDAVVEVVEGHVAVG